MPEKQGQNRVVKLLLIRIDDELGDCHGLTASLNFMTAWPVTIILGAVGFKMKFTTVNHLA